MAKKAKEKPKQKQKEKTLSVPLWSTLDDGDKSKIMTVTGLILAVFALFTLVAVVSYLFTWKQDMSLLNNANMMNHDTEVGNMAGKLGFKWAHFLVAECFGLGSIALAFILGLFSIRLLRRKSMPLIKLTLAAVSFALIVSFILSFFSSVFGTGDMFGGGIGGDSGAAFINWMNNLCGSIVTFAVLFVMAALWVIFVINPKFKKKEPIDDSSVEVDPKEQEVYEASKSGEDLYEEETKYEPVVEPEPEIEVEPEPEPEIQQEPLQPVFEFVHDNPAADPFAPVVAPTMNAKVKEPVEVVVEPESEEVPGFEVVQEGDELSTDVQEELPRIDIRDELPRYEFPSLDILEDYASSRQEVSSEELARNNNKIRATLANYKISVDDVKAVVGPTVTLYKVYPSAGVKISAIKNLQDDIAMYLHAKGVRVVNLPDSVGIEVANDVPSTVPLKATLNDESFRNTKAELPVAIGYTITQKVKVFDLADAPHLLVAGATKQGKSVGLNVIVASLLYAKHPSELKLVFIDPKMVEFSSYAKLLKHYLAVLPTAGDEQEEREQAIVKKPKQAEQILRSLCIEMDERYELLSKAYVNNIKLYNEKYKDRHLLPTDGHHFLPYIVVVIDEYADLTMSVGGGGEARNIAKSITTSIIRLAQKGRAAGIHVILATQRPSVDVITGLIKTNFPTRIAFRVVSRVDSATILDSPGADKLIGKGDMLFYAGVETERVQCAFISNDEINRLTDCIGEQTGYKKCYNTPYYLPEPDPAASDGGEGGGGMIDMKNLDERFEEAARLVVTSQKGSTSDIQRRLGMGYAKAGRVMDQLEAAGIVGPQEGSKPRQVLVGSLDELDRILEAYMG